jgi:hypothetical protein
MQIAEQGLVPAIRKAPSDALIIADGFSCREQIKHVTGRWAMHPAELLSQSTPKVTCPRRPCLRRIGPRPHGWNHGWQQEPGSLPLASGFFFISRCAIRARPADRGFRLPFYSVVEGNGDQNVGSSPFF